MYRVDVLSAWTQSLFVAERRHKTSDFVNCVITYFQCLWAIPIIKLRQISDVLDGGLQHILPDSGVDWGSGLVTFQSFIFRFPFL